MVGQAIIDAVIDLAIPVATTYGDVIGDLELDILTRPNITHTKKLYIVITELNKILSFITPVVNLINALRDHKTEMSQGEPFPVVYLICFWGWEPMASTRVPILWCSCKT